MTTDFFSYGNPEPPPPPPTPPVPGQASAFRSIGADWADDDWDRLLGFVARRRYPAGAVVARAGEALPGLLLVATGAVEIRIAAGSVSRRSQGEVAGSLSFLDDAPCAGTIVALTDAEVLVLTSAGLMQLAAWHPRLALSLVRDLAAGVAARLRRVEPGD